MLSPHFYNRDLEISDNRIENYKQGCISVTNSLGVVSRRNTCIRDSNAEKTALPWFVVRSKGVINE
uniref:Uncharacterized protein n=1 Tax=Curvibacter symbiont subsp. Hydra magnipapillata TaxID=667019 RepID=C9Y8B2_CURXX|nr:hypothetical protein Csp_A03630 [Curvibacter putative symbiont of Hydra magnipapillata]